MAVAGLRLFLVALVLFLGTGATYFIATNYSYNFDNIALSYGVLTAASWIFFLLGFALVVIGSTDCGGRLRVPESLKLLLCWTMLLPQGGFAIGLIVNSQSSVEIMMAVSNSPGVEVRFIGNGGALLDGEIGLSTFDPLAEERRRNEVLVLKLKSPGGLISAAQSIGTLLKTYGIATFVEGHCESACVIVALSSAELHVSPNAQFGFHRGSAVASSESELGKFIANLATDDLISQLRGLGVPESVLRRAEETPPDQMHYVSGEDIYRFGLAQHLVE